VRGIKQEEGGEPKMGFLLIPDTGVSVHIEVGMHFENFERFCVSHFNIERNNNEYLPQELYASMRLKRNNSL
jgi:hypothetical protein